MRVSVIVTLKINRRLYKHGVWFRTHITWARLVLIVALGPLPAGCIIDLCISSLSLALSVIVVRAFSRTSTCSVAVDVAVWTFLGIWPWFGTGTASPAWDVFVVWTFPGSSTGAGTRTLSSVPLLDLNNGSCLGISAALLGLCVAALGTSTLLLTVGAV